MCILLLCYLNFIVETQSLLMCCAESMLFTGGCSCMRSPSGHQGCCAARWLRIGLRSRNAWRRCPRRHLHPSSAGFHSVPGPIRCPVNTPAQHIEHFFVIMSKAKTVKIICMFNLKVKGLTTNQNLTPMVKDHFSFLQIGSLSVSYD